MSMRKPTWACRLAALSTGVALFTASAFAAGPSKPVPALGEPVAKDIVSAWDTTIYPDGTGLPAGSGTAKQGFPNYHSPIRKLRRRSALTGLTQRRYLITSTALCR